MTRRIVLVCAVLGACAARPVDAPILAAPVAPTEPRMARAQRLCAHVRGYNEWASCFHTTLYPH